MITNGYGAMYSYAERVTPADRWAIIAYIRALQASETRSARRRAGRQAAGPAMSAAQTWTRVSWAALALALLGVVGCAVGAAIDLTGVFPRLAVQRICFGSACRWPA